MKKSLSVILIFIVLFSICGCKNQVQFHEIKFETTNYNNTYYPSDDGFWVNGNTYIYNLDGFYNMRAFIYQNGHSVKLFESNDFPNETYSATCLALDDFLYFTTTSEDDRQHFYKYTFTTQSYSKLFTIDGCSVWQGTPDYIAFAKHRVEETLTDLYIYDIETGLTSSICDGILEFGIVNDEIRYLGPVNADTLGLYKYDRSGNTSEKLAQISIKTEEYSTYNFTTNYVVFAQYDSDDYRKVSVYADGVTTEYTLPKPVQQFVAGEQYAYAVCYDTEEYSSTALKHKDNGIYKINLADGSYEVVETADDDTEIYVVSDDEIYIIQSKLNLIGQYKGHIFRLNVPDKTKTKVFVI